MNNVIPFNKPFLIGNELKYIKNVVKAGKISGDGVFTKKCNQYFKDRFGFNNVLLTTSCTDALEMSAILLDIKPGDEVIVPSFTFVSSANAFVLRGAKIIFADSTSGHPNVDVTTIAPLITKKTKVIVLVHYAGTACDIDPIKELADQNGIHIVEDAAQAIDSYYKGKPLGSFGTFAAFSFHETKNIISGEGGLLVINDEKFTKRAEIIREKGTNRSAFFRGEIDKYGWVDIGSSFLPSDIISAYLYAQLENLDKIQSKRKKIWNRYSKNLRSLEKEGKLKVSAVPDFATNNGHIFYILTNSLAERQNLITHLNSNEIYPAFHYQSLHDSPYYKQKKYSAVLTNSDYYSDHLLRLPLYFELKLKEVDYICEIIANFYKK